MKNTTPPTLINESIMANNKVGFDYYNVDTDRYQDRRIKRLKKDLGCSGIAIYDYILCEIYRVKGCFLEWDESTAFDVADYFGVKESLVNEVVNYCGVVGLFDKGLLTSGRIITSLSIQRRYLEMSARAKRKCFGIPKNIKLPEVSEIIPEESHDCSSSLPQSKVKESNISTNVLVEVPSTAPPLDDPMTDLKSAYHVLPKNKNDVVKFISSNHPKFIDPYFDLWNLFAKEKGLPVCQVLNDSRKRKFKTRINEKEFDFLKILKAANNSPFALEKKWFTFDWLIENQTNYMKMIEGNYSNKQVQTPTNNAYKQSTIEEQLEQRERKMARYSHPTDPGHEQSSAA